MNQAKDADQPNTKNSEIHYEIIAGNFDKKFGIDEKTGKIFVTQPLGLDPEMDGDGLFNSESFDYIDANMKTSKLHSSGMIQRKMVNLEIRILEIVISVAI